MELIGHDASWKAGVRVLLLKGRHKDGLEVQRTFQRVTDCEKEFDRAEAELTELSWPGERIYVSASPRNMDRAVRLFRERQLANEYDENPLEFYGRLWDRWASCLMSPSVQCKQGKVWMFDCDSAEELADVEEGISGGYSKGGFLYKYPTKSGTHILVKPFNKSLLSDSQRARLQENPLMLWGY